MGENKTPIVLFVYKRLDVTIQTIEALKNNIGFVEHDIYIYSDGPKTSSDVEKVDEVRKYLKTISGFKKVKIIESTENKGLANSIIEGVSEIFKSYDRVIVLEDDLVTSKYFLSYMKNCLETYKCDDRIWSISGYVPPIDIPSNYSSDVFLIRKGASWGWATWKDRWQTIDWEIKDYEEFKQNKKSIKEFNNVGDNMSRMLKLQMTGKIDSWAIRWIYNQFKLNKYTVYPTKSLVSNIGFGSEATHGSTNPEKWSSKLTKRELFPFRGINIAKELEESFKKYYDLDIKGSISYFLKQNMHPLHKIAKRGYTRFINKN